MTWASVTHPVRLAVVITIRHCKDQKSAYQRQGVKKGQTADTVGMNHNTISTLIKESNGLRLIKALPNGYEITDDYFINPPQKDTAHAVYNEIYRFCMTKGTNPPQ